MTNDISGNSIEDAKSRKKDQLLDSTLIIALIVVISFLAIDTINLDKQPERYDDGTINKEGVMMLEIIIILALMFPIPLLFARIKGMINY